jgi:hypothetical protein
MDTKRRNGMKHLATVDAKALAAATFCQAKGDVRYYLNGVLIQPRAEGGVYIVSTDGHRLIEIIDKAGYCEEEFIVSMATNVVTKLKAAGSDKAEITQPDDKMDTVIRVSGKAGKEDYIAIVTIVDGRFPTWGSVLPKDLAPNPAPLAPINPVLLMAFCEIGKLLLPKKGSAISIVHGATKHEAVTILFSNMENRNLHARGLIMPIKVDNLHWLPQT